MVRASAGNSSSYPTSSLDYTISSYFTPTNGSASAGWVKWIGYNGIPTIGTNGGMILTQYQWWENLYVVAITAGGVASYGLLGCSNAVVKKCIINCNNLASVVGINISQGVVSETEFYGGTTSPSVSAGAYLLSMGAYGGSVDGCTLRYGRDHGIYCLSDAGLQVRNTRIYRCVSNGIHTLLGSTARGEIINNTIDANQGHGIRIDGTNDATFWTIRNNNITNHTQASKYGISVATSSSDKRKADWGYNNVWNNTSNYENVTADSTDFSVDPGYTDASTGNFTPSNTALKAAFPTSF